MAIRRMDRSAILAELDGEHGAAIGTRAFGWLRTRHFGYYLLHWARMLHVGRQLLGLLTVATHWLQLTFGANGVVELADWLDQAAHTLTGLRAALIFWQGKSNTFNWILFTRYLWSGSFLRSPSLILHLVLAVSTIWFRYDIA